MPLKPFSLQPRELLTIQTEASSIPTVPYGGFKPLLRDKGWTGQKIWIPLVDQFRTVKQGDISVLGLLLYPLVPLTPVMALQLQHRGTCFWGWGRLLICTQLEKSGLEVTPTLCLRALPYHNAGKGIRT